MTNIDSRRRPITRGLIGLAAMLLLSSSARAQPGLSLEGAGPVPPGRCIDGVVHDDGGVEAAFGLLPRAPRGGFVEPFDVTDIQSGLSVICVCLVADLDFPVPDRELAFQVVVYDDDGLGGTPGSLISSTPSLAEEIPVDLPGAIYSVDVDGAPGSLPSSGIVFIGIEWNPLEEGSIFFVCNDRDQDPHGGFVSSENFYDWTRIEEIFPNHYGSMVIRAKGREPSIVEIPTLSLGGIAAFALVLGLLGWRRVASR